MNALHKNRPRRNGHDASQHLTTNDLESCPYCGQEIGGDRAAVLAHIANMERTRLARLETALRQQFVREQRQAVATAKAAAETARKQAIAVAEKKLKLIRDQQAAVIAAEREAGAKRLTEAVSTEKLQHAAEKLRLETALADMQRKLAAKPAHAIGEPGELDLFESMLKICPDDLVTRVKRGTPGPDVRIQVRLGDVVIGSIILDSKVHARWSNKFTGKLRADQLAEGADFAILVTSIFPSGAHELHLQDGVVVTSPQRAPVLVQLLRRQIVEHHRLKLTNSARSSRGEALLIYLTGPQADDLLEALHTATNSLIAGEVAEVNDHQARWRKRGELLRTLQKGHEDLVAAFDAIIQGADPMLNEEVTE